MSAINGLRIVLTLEDPAGAFVQCGLGLQNAVAATQTPYTITIYDPTLFLNIVRVASKLPDNMIRIS